MTFDRTTKQKTVTEEMLEAGAKAYLKCSDIFWEGLDDSQRQSAAGRALEIYRAMEKSLTR